jgi:hypothetical protein
MNIFKHMLDPIGEDLAHTLILSFIPLFDAKPKSNTITAATFGTLLMTLIRLFYTA